jgi:hypothetical protein
MWKKSKRLLFKVMIGKSVPQQHERIGKSRQTGPAWPSLQTENKAIASKEKHVSRQRSW